MSQPIRYDARGSLKPHSLLFLRIILRKIASQFCQKCSR
ncbi:hypothetical protein CES85_0739 [Ochrobactrum quorumnocens]|uniref:Uncharacterized protein n=1 Tax=Ochrobactrum quorumnocens TaxID=271865 RepID=A0A248UGY8_9HYPH|nr:hypothetical protein CES85_0739 [[Ochrobactrum] quorumnocens]